MIVWQAKWGRSFAFGAPAFAVVALSLAFTSDRVSGAGDEPPRFSGSNVVVRSRSLLPGIALPGGLRVLIVRDPAAARFYDKPATLDSIISAWRTLLVQSGAMVRVVSPEQLDSETGSVVVLPSSPCLSISTREALDRAGSRGHGLIVSGQTGTRDAGCRSIGYGLLVELTGASRIEPVAEKEVVYASVPAGSPLSAGLPPAARLAIAPGSQLALRVRQRDVHYSDYTHGSLPVNDEPYLDGAIVRSSYRGARVVYFGFEPREVRDDQWSRAVVRTLARNAVAWASGVPVATLAPWPDGKRWAAIVSQDVEDGYEFARHSVDSLRAIGVPGTFFIVSDLGEKHRELTAQLAHIGEVGSHSDDHRLLGGTPYGSQLARLSRSRDMVRSLTRQQSLGMRPPEEQFDEATMRAWIAAGGDYMVGPNDSRVAAPELLLAGDDTLVLIPRVFADDFLATGPQRRRAPDLVLAMLQDDARRARESGGLYLLSYHSQVLSRPEYVAVLARAARTLREDGDIWLTTAGNVAQWWRARSRASVEVERVGRNYIDIVIRNSHADALENVELLVTAPSGRRIAPGAGLSEENGVTRVATSRIPAGSEARLRLPLVANRAD